MRPESAALRHFTADGIDEYGIKLNGQITIANDDHDPSQADAVTIAVLAVLSVAGVAEQVKLNAKAPSCHPSPSPSSEANFAEQSWSSQNRPLDHDDGLRVECAKHNLKTLAGRPPLESLPHD